MRTLFAIFLLFFSMSLIAQENIQVYSPYDSPPYIINFEKGQGLFFDFVKELNENFKGRYHFIANSVPRSRLKLIMNKTTNTIVVPFVAPGWFDDLGEKKYLWTTQISEDCNVVIYRGGRLNEIKKMDDLVGGATSVVNGQYTSSIQKLIDQKKVRVENANHVVQNFLILSKGRVDFLVTGYTVADYVIKDQKLKNLIILDSPVDVFSRKILISTKGKNGVGEQIKEALSAFIKNEKMQKLFRKYELSSTPLICKNKLLSQ